MAKKPPKFTERIRRAIQNSGVSRYQISKQTGIDQAVLSKFVNGHLGFTLETLDKLADYLQFDLSSKGPKKAGMNHGVRL
jgi:ribosome-binding protein aMBF1 (putative translation factor)